MSTSASPWVVVRRAAVRGSALALFAALAAACPAAPPAQEPHHAPAVADASPAPPVAEPEWSACPEAAGPAVVSRDDLTAFLDRGLPDLLGRVRTAPVLDHEGAGARFLGFRIVALDPALRCGVLGLREGDVVSAVNGRGIERPDDALEVWNSLFEATEIRVTLLRGGVESEAVVTVEDRPVRIDNGGVTPAGP